jgi:hypothetical protein
MKTAALRVVLSNILNTALAFSDENGAQAHVEYSAHAEFFQVRFFSCGWSRDLPDLGLSWEKHFYLDGDDVLGEADDCLCELRKAFDAAHSVAVLSEPVAVAL